jgi:RimJ/RimL family protein N-acetyltransferase
MESHILQNGQLLHIRQGEEQDAEAYLLYLHAIASESDNLTFGTDDVSLTVEQQIQNIRELMEREHDLFLLAEIEGEIVGNLTFRSGKRPRTQHAGEFGVSVRQKYWGKGIGKLLISSLLTWAREHRQIRKVNLRVRADHAGAIQLYQEMGFQVEGRLTREFMINGEFFDALVMGKKIDPIEVESEQDGRHPEVVIRSERICLRLTTENDLSFVLETEYQEENSQFIIPWNKQQHRAALQDENVLHAIIETNVEKRAIGYVIIKGLRNVNQSIELMRVVITEKGQGWGRETLRLIKAWAFETQEAHRL